MAQYPAVITLASAMDPALGAYLFADPGPTFSAAGIKVASAGDVNGDGFDDLVVGSPYRGEDDEFDFAGAAYVVFGGPDGFDGSPYLDAMANGDGFILHPWVEGTHRPFDPTYMVGSSVTGLGDLNGDGFDDVAIGSPGFLAILSGRANFFVDQYANELPRYAGGGPLAAPAGDINGDGLADFIVAQPNANNGSGVVGAAAIVFGGGASGRLWGAAPGEAVAAAIGGGEDINGDGFDDLILGAPTSDDGGAGSGAAWVVFGGPSLVNTPAALSSVAGFEIIGEAGSGLGNAVALAGDVNGDGFADLIVGASNDDADGADAGAAWVIFGAVGGFPATLDLSALTPSQGFRIGGAAAGDRLGHSVSSAGDVNGDGYDDIIVGAPEWGARQGSAYVIFGQAESFGAQIDIGGLDGTNGFRIAGRPDGGGGLGMSVGHGDFNGDGLDDLAIEASYSDAYVVFGRPPEARVVRTGNAFDQSLAGGAFNDVLSGLGGDDRLGGGAGIDRLFGGDGQDELIGGADNDLLDGGAGADVMRGGTGNDVYYVDDVGDRVIERAGEGSDIIRTSLSWTLSAEVETLQLQGAANASGTGNEGANNLQGNGGDNTLSGLGGVDTINGGDGDDHIVGGLGNDLLRGGAGADVFVVAHAFGPVLETDLVYDFSTAEGDIVDLSGVDAIAGGGDDAFTLVTAFTRHAGEMTLSFVAGVTLLRLDVDGDGKADYQMKINGDVTGESSGWLL